MRPEWRPSATPVFSLNLKSNKTTFTYFEYVLIVEMRGCGILWAETENALVTNHIWKAEVLSCSACLHVYLSCLSVKASSLSVCLSLCLFVCVCVCLCLSIHVYLSVCLSCLYVKAASLALCFCVCLFMFLCVCLFMCVSLYACVSVFVSVYLSIEASSCSITLSVCLSLCLSVVKYSQWNLN